MKNHSLAAGDRKKYEMPADQILLEGREVDEESSQFFSESDGKCVRAAEFLVISFVFQMHFWRLFV